MKKFNASPQPEPAITTGEPTSALRVKTVDAGHEIAELGRAVDLSLITMDEAIERILLLELDAVGDLLTSAGRNDLEEILRNSLETDPAVSRLRRS
jgi:hypothetical protein